MLSLDHPRRASACRPALVFRNASWQGLLALLLILCAITAVVAFPKGGLSNPAIAAIPAFASVLVLVLVLMRLRACLHPHNWLLLAAQDGLWINLRSCLNHHLADDADVVVFIPSQDVAAIGKTREQRRLRDAHGEFTRREDFIDIYLRHEDTAALAEAMRRERRRAPPPRWFRRERALDYRVSLPAPGIVRLEWHWIRPSEGAALGLLGGSYPIAPDRSVELAAWDALSPAEKDALIADTWERGKCEEAAAMYQAHYGGRQRQARRLLREKWGA